LDVYEVPVSNLSEADALREILSCRPSNGRVTDELDMMCKEAVGGLVEALVGTENLIRIAEI
jgi:hypothetical protein